MNPLDIKGFPINLKTIADGYRSRLDELASALMSDYRIKKQEKLKTSKLTGDILYEEFYPRLSKSIIDEIDRVLAQHYGFTDQELDFIINYDIKYRMGRDAQVSEED